MRILYIFRSLAVWGGIERILVDKMNYLVSMYGYEVFLLTTDQGTHPIPYSLEKDIQLEDLEINFHHQYRYHGLKRLFVAKCCALLFKQRLAEKIQAIHPDVIICTTANSLDLNILVRLKGKIPLVVESHSTCMHTIESNKGWFRNKWSRYQYLKALAKSDVLVALTEGDAVEWSKVHPRVVVITNKVHLNDGAVSKLENKRIIFVGRFDYQKRPIDMIHIWEMIHPQYPDWQLDIYGEGEQQEELEDQVRSSNMNIVVHHPTDHIFDCYRESSILVSTSLFEPFGLVIPEAMSCGLPVVAFDCLYGPADIITDGVDGFLIKNRDNKAFADRVCQLIESYELRLQMGKAGIASSKRYRSEIIMPQWVSLFNQIVSSQ